MSLLPDSCCRYSKLALGGTRARVCGSLTLPLLFDDSQLRDFHETLKANLIARVDNEYYIELTRSLSIDSGSSCRNFCTKGVIPVPLIFVKIFCFICLKHGLQYLKLSIYSYPNLGPWLFNLKIQTFRCPIIGKKSKFLLEQKSALL